MHALRSVGDLKPATMERKIRSLEESIRVLHGTLMEIQNGMLELMARSAAHAASHGLEGDMSPSPSPVPAGHKDDAGGE